MRGLVFVAALLLVASACAAKETSPTAPYSFDYWNWIADSRGLAIELDGIREMANQPSQEPVTRAALRDAIGRQAQFNTKMLVTRPPEDWRPYQAKIVADINSYNRWVEGMSIAFDQSPLPFVVAQLQDEQLLLRQRVTNCFAQSPACE
jgi:hypothetical protein